MGVGVERAQLVTLFGLGPEDRVDVGGGMHALEIGARGERRLAPVALETTGRERVEHRPQPLRPLWMSRAGAVAQHVGMSEHGYRHRA